LINFLKTKEYVFLIRHLLIYRKCSHFQTVYLIWKALVFDEADQQKVDIKISLGAFKCFLSRCFKKRALHALVRYVIYSC